jgi:putative transposase
MTRKPYPSDLNDDEWAVLEPLIPPAKRGGRPRTTDRREVINAIRYRLRTGCQWDWLPHDFPPKGTVFYSFNPWRQDGTWARWNRILARQLRQSEGRESTPSAAILDRQSVKTTEKGA